MISSVYTSEHFSFKKKKNTHTMKSIKFVIDLLYFEIHNDIKKKKSSRKNTLSRNFNLI